MIKNKNNYLKHLEVYINSDSNLEYTLSTFEKDYNGLYWNSEKKELYFSKKSSIESCKEHKIFSNSGSKEFSIKTLREKILREILKINELIFSINGRHSFNKYFVEEYDLTIINKVLDNVIDYRFLGPYDVTLLIFSGRTVYIDKFDADLVEAIDHYVSMNVLSVDALSASKSLYFIEDQFNIDFTDIKLHKDFIYDRALKFFKDKAEEFLDNNYEKREDKEIIWEMIGDKAIILFKIMQDDNIVIKDIRKSLKELDVEFNELTVLKSRGIKELIKL